MIRFIFGANGTGKTTEIINMIREDSEKSVPSFLIVPEQEALQAERLTLSLLPPAAQLSLEVLNFSRLYNRVCREYGGLSYKYITKPMKSLLMWKDMKDLAPFMKEYNTSSADMALIRTMLTQVEEMKSCGITPEKLELTASKLDESSSLRKKLEDFTMIYATYRAHVSENYTDSSDDMTRLYDLLNEVDFFNGKNVYIDSFTSFTATEHKVIERIFASAQNVTVSVPLPSPEHDDISAASVRDSLKRLMKNADRHGGARLVTLTERKRSEHETLNRLSLDLWRLELGGEDSHLANDGSIVMEVCSTPYAEAEAVASHISELLRNGARCRDILIVMRDIEKYRGIIEPALEKNKIPFFLSEKTDLCAMSPIKLILTALRIKQYNWRRNDVISHIKTGLCDFDVRDADIFEDYINTWNIRGEKFLAPVWTMNPDGYTDMTNERTEMILNTANSVKDKLTPPLLKLFVLLDSSENIGDMCRAIYSYLTDICLEDKLLALSKKEAENGNRHASEEYLSLYGIILNTLADIGDALGEEEADAEELSAILRTVFSEIKVGIIPTSVDEVTIGSAAMIRGANPKYTFVMGLCDGDFPAAVNDTSLFNSSDRELLAELDVELAGNSDTRSSDELMFVQRAFSYPSEKLWLSYHSSEANGKAKTPSLPFDRVKKMFGITPHEYDGTDLRYLAGSPLSAMAHVRELSGTSDGETLKAVLEEFIPVSRELLPLEASEPQCRVSAEIMKTSVGGKMYLTPSRLEKYVKCPFSYFGSYVLGLRERKNGEFRHNDIGNFIHHVLEKLLPHAVEKKLSEEELSLLTEKIVEEYLEAISPKGSSASPRLKHLYDRLISLSRLMISNIIDEFDASDFEPAYYELSTDSRKGIVNPWELILDDGNKVTLSGTIDRVDILRKDSEVYIRVVDYKTGTKNFSLEEVAMGLNTQMLLYLFTLCQKNNEKFHIELGLDDGRSPIPCGVIYLDANISTLTLDEAIDETEIESRAKKELKRTGLLLNDEEILTAMNHDLSPDFLAGVKKSKKGDLSGGALMSSEGFNAVYKQVEDTIKKIGRELGSGICDAKPLILGTRSPCDYCEMRPVCRRID